MKFKLGDKVKVRSWGSMEAEFVLNYGEIDNPDYPFVEDMKRYCGKYVTISGCHRNYYNIKEDNEQYSWTVTMFEDVVGHKFKVGDIVKEFKLPNAVSKEISLSEVLENNDKDVEEEVDLNVFNGTLEELTGMTLK